MYTMRPKLIPAHNEIKKDEILSNYIIRIPNMIPTLNEPANTTQSTHSFASLGRINA
jgi:hypothetical protein